MANTEQDLSNKLDQLANDVNTAVTTTQSGTADLKAQIAALQAQVAGGTPVSQEQLDAMVAKVDAIDAAVQPLVAPPTV